MTAVIALENETRKSESMESAFTEPSTERQERMDSDALSAQRLLATRARQGDEGAFVDILDRYKGLMLRTAYSIVKDRDIAEDAVQNALIQAWQHLPSLRETGALRPWLTRIVVNQCISFKRHLARSTMFLRQSLAAQETERASQIADYAEGRVERNWDLARAIEDLPAKQRVAIALHYFQGMTLTEMSQTLRTSENTLKKRIQAALSNLRHVMRSDEAILSPDHL